MSSKLERCFCIQIVSFSLLVYIDREGNVGRAEKQKTHEMINTSFYFYKYFTEQISEYNKKLRIKWRIHSPLNIIVVLQKCIIHHRFVHIAVELFRFVLNILVKINYKRMKSRTHL